MSFKQSLPNLLTGFRVAVIPVICILIFLPYQTACWFAFGLYVAAAVSDFLDGYLARLWNAGSVLGRVFDPIADKLLIAAILLCLAGNAEIVPFGMIPAIVIILRELLVSGLREYLGTKSIVLPVSRLAKWKTTAQLVSVGLLLIAPIWGLYYYSGLVLLWIASGLTAWTGWEYLRATFPSENDDRSI